MAMSNGAPVPEDQSQDVLTGIPLPLQLAATSCEGEGDSGAEEASIQAFIETLARIARSVASRNTRQDQQERKDQ
jgi:hypothetical protein